MKIDREHALRLWQARYGAAWFVRDFHGNLMQRDRYGDPKARAFGTRGIEYVGWNLHHILPQAHGGTNEENNLICTNIRTNEAAEDKTTFWIDDCRYQVCRIPGSREYEIVRLA